MLLPGASGPENSRHPLPPPLYQSLKGTAHFRYDKMFSLLKMQLQQALLLPGKPPISYTVCGHFEQEYYGTLISLLRRMFLMVSTFSLNLIFSLQFFSMLNNRLIRHGHFLICVCRTLSAFFSWKNPRHMPALRYLRSRAVMCRCSS